jgi:hypothetical protein
VSAAEKNRNALVLRPIIFVISLGMNLLHLSLRSAHQDVSRFYYFSGSFLFKYTATGEVISVLLRQRCDQLLRLQTRWTTPLASSLRFASRAKSALKIAITLSGGSQIPTGMHWLSPTSVKVADPEGELDHVELAENLDLLVVESEHAVLADIIAGSNEDDDFDLMDYVTDTHAVIVWEAPEVRTIISLTIFG